MSNKGEVSFREEESREIWFFCLFKVENSRVDRTKNCLILLDLERHHGDDEEKCNP